MTRYYEAPSDLEIEEVIVLERIKCFNKGCKEGLVRVYVNTPDEANMLCDVCHGKGTLEFTNQMKAQTLHDLIKKQKCLEEMDKKELVYFLDNIDPHILNSKPVLAHHIHATFGKPVLEEIDVLTLKSFMNTICYECKGQCFPQTCSVLPNKVVKKFGKPVGMIVPEKTYCKAYTESRQKCGEEGCAELYCPHYEKNKAIDDFHKLNKKEG